MEHIDRYPGVLEDLWAKVADLLAGRGLSPETAHEAAFGITEHIRSEWAGRNHYIPKGRLKAPPAREPESGRLFGPEPEPPSQALPELLCRLQEASTAILAEQGVPEAEAAALARAVADLVRRDWAGERIYVAKGKAYDLSRRDYSICREWDGSYSSKLVLMQRHGITEQRFYQIIAAVRRRHWKRVQPPLFE